jgi:hypothetical protein
MILPALLLLQAATTATQTGTFQSRRVTESSGVAVSRAHPGVLWTHNDSGDRPYLYATDLRGADRGALLVPGADARDWEDITLGPCPPPLAPSRAARPRPLASCLYLADTGDNLEARPSVTIYAIPEPDPPAGPGDTLRTTAAPAVLRLRYPDGSHDVEAVYVSPRDSALYLVSKGRSGRIRLYRVNRSQWGRPGKATAERVQTLDVRPNLEAGRVVTSAAVRRDGRLVAIRTYSEIYLFAPGVGGRLSPARERPCDISGLELGGEAIDFLNDTTLVLTSEGVGRRAGAIHTVVCRRR